MIDFARAFRFEALQADSAGVVRGTVVVEFGAFRKSGPIRYERNGTPPLAIPDWLQSFLESTCQTPEHVRDVISYIREQLSDEIVRRKDLR